MPKKDVIIYADKPFPYLYLCFVSNTTVSHSVGDVTNELFVNDYSMLDKLAEESHLPPRIENAFKLFLKRTPPERLNRTVRTLFIEYLSHQHDFLPPDFHLYLDDLSNLFILLDKIDCETKGWYTECEEKN